MQDTMETNLTAAGDTLKEVYQAFREAEAALKEACAEVKSRVDEDKAEAATRADELDEQAAASTGVRALMLAQRAKDFRAKGCGMSDEERDLLAELKQDATDKLTALRHVRKSTLETAKAAKAEYDALYREAVQIDCELCGRWIDTEKFEAKYGRIV